MQQQHQAPAPSMGGMSGGFSADESKQEDAPMKAEGGFNGGSMDQMGGGMPGGFSSPQPPVVSSPSFASPRNTFF